MQVKNPHPTQYAKDERAMGGRGREGRQDLVGGRYLTDFYYLCTANETTEEARSFLRSLYSIATEQTKVKEEDCQ